jgi:hypothetical protein
MRTENTSSRVVRQLFVKHLRSAFPLLVVLAAFALAPSARASEVFYFSEAACSCGSPNYGEVILNVIDSTDTSVEVELLNGNEFVRTGAGESLEFDITGTPTVTITNLTTGFTVGGAASASTFGSFDYSIHCSGCGNGGSSPLPGPIFFDINVGIGAFTDNSDGIYFTSDILGAGKTGDVGSPGFVPEPFSFSLVGVGLLGLGLLRRRLSA